MRYGCCVGPELIEAAAAAGYDYVELPVAAVLPERPEAEWEPVRERLRAGPLRPQAWRLFLAPDLRATGPEVDWPRLSRYAYTALRRIADVGGAVVVFGSGPQRNVPEGFPREEACDQVTELLRVCGAAGRARGLMIAIEPMSVTYCNFITSLPEAVALAKAVGMPEIGVAPDAFHMARDEQSPLDVVDAAEWLAHVHVPGAAAAAASMGEWTDQFLDALRLADYDWRISIEAEWEDAGELGPALAVLRRCVEDAMRRGI